jgi:hypothetical protein
VSYIVEHKAETIPFECDGCRSGGDAFCDCFSLARERANILGEGATVSRNGVVLATSRRNYAAISAADRANDLATGVVRPPRAVKSRADCWARGSARSAARARGVPRRRRAA